MRRCLRGMSEFKEECPSSFNDAVTRRRRAVRGDRGEIVEMARGWYG